MGDFRVLSYGGDQDRFRRRGSWRRHNPWGVNHKTLTAALDSGTLTPRLSDAMENRGVREVRRWVEGLKSCVEAVERWGENISDEIKEIVVKPDNTGVC